MDTGTPKHSEEQTPSKRGRGRPRLYPPGDPRYAVRSRDYAREYQRNRRGTQAGQMTQMIWASRHRAKKAGIEHTITVDDLDWPTHCPVLGIELNYSGTGRVGGHTPNSASLDRWDNTKGYIPGNVRVISDRANRLKNNGTPDELMAVARYAKYGAAPPELTDIW